MSNTNFLFAYYNLNTSTTIVTPVIEGDCGDVLTFDVLIEGLSGAPTTASLTAKFQIAPLNYHGYSLDAEFSGLTRPWIDVASADTYSGNILVDGDWPTSLADQTFGSSATRLISRRIRIPALGRLIRLSITSSFTGGTSPGFRITSCCATNGTTLQ